jgi:hypothetical protein
MPDVAAIMITVWTARKSLGQSSPTRSPEAKYRCEQAQESNAVKYPAVHLGTIDRVLLWRKSIMYRNDENLDSETYLLFAIYSQACRLKCDSRPTAKSYLKTFGKEIQGTARVLEWLGLATPDKTSPLGCRPTTLLMWIIARQPNRPLKAKKSDPSAQDEDAIDSIIDAALADDRFSTNAQSFVRHVLGGLGLIKRTEGGDWAPTRLLRELAAHRRNEDRRLEYEQHCTEAH